MTDYKPTSLLLTCFAFLCISSSSLHGQTSPLKYDKFTTENGLSSNVIYNVLQDSKGYLWIATNEGINRYDGYKFAAYRHTPGNETSISGNQVYFIYEDRNGNIWAGTDGGLVKYKTSTNNFERITPRQDSIFSGVTQVLHLNDKEIILVVSNRVLLFNIHTFSTKELVDSITHRPYRFMPVNLARNKQGNVYLAGYSEGYPDINSILKYDSNKKIFQPLIHSPFSKGGIDQTELISNLFIDSRNTFWISTVDKIYACSAEGTVKNSFKPVLVNDDVKNLVNIFEDRDGKIWFAGSGGVLRFEYESARITRIIDESANKIFQDKTGVIWIGCFNGLFKLNVAQHKFRHLTSKGGDKLKLLSDFVLGVREIQGKKILIDYHWGEKNFSEFDPVSQNIHHYSRTDFSPEDYIKRFKIKTYTYFKEDSLKKLRHSTKFSLITHKEALLIPDDRGRLWMVHMPLFYLPDTPNHKVHFENYLSDVGLYLDEFWVTTNGYGLWSISTSTYKVKKYTASAEGKKAVSSNHQNCLLIEKNGNIWVGTKGTGIDYFDRKNNRFLNYTTQNGLSNNSVFSLVFDDKGRLWIGTGNGLSCFDTSTKIFTNFHRSDGLTNSEFNRYSACKLPGGYLMMGGMNGIDYFHPDSVMGTFSKPVVQITDLKVFNKTVMPAENISLSHNNNYVTIEFAAMDFRNPAANKFAYQLKGIDKDWVMAGNQRSVSYATLAPGNYHFLVKAAGSDGIWNDVPAEIFFTISTPWWRTGWFYTATGLFVFAILYSIYRFRIYQLKKVFAVRTKISQDLHDEVGATLTSISFLSEVAKQQKGNNETIDKIGEFSRDMISEMNDIVWAINPANDKFEKIENRMENFASTFLAAKNIEFNFKSDGQIRNISLGMQQRKNLYLIFKEAINNAAKYSESTEVNVAIIRENNHIQLVIADNGRGFLFGQENSNGGGNGLKNMKERAAEINAHFSIQSSPGKGTRISVSVPITQNAY